MCARVKFLVGVSQMSVSDVRIDLCGGNVGVSEKLLDGANVGLMLNEMRCKTVAKRVRRNVFKSDFCGVFFDEKKNRLPVYRSA